jgi:phospholipid-binding lipoprotein MlaA
VRVANFRWLYAVCGLCLVAGGASVSPPAVAAIASVAPAATTADVDAAPHDPFERLNRGAFEFGRFIDRTAVSPTVHGLQQITPKPVRTAGHNVLVNLSEPTVFANDVLQVRFGQAGQTLARFVVNSTIGVAGVADPAKGFGLAHHNNDFGLTLGRYGAPPGPYLFLPLLGPSSLRDATGALVDIAADPLTWTRFAGAGGVEAARTGAAGVDARLGADDAIAALDATAVDPYAAARSVYLQARRAEIKGEGAMDLEPLPDLAADPSAPSEPQAPSASLGPAAAESRSLAQ